MNNILIIYPHWPPSNLAGVHRPRLIANFLPHFDWHPIVLTVHERNYEESFDYDLNLTVGAGVEVIKTDACQVIRLFGRRIVGDIGIRAFGALYMKALEIIHSRTIDFIWIPIPSWYTAILGRLLHEKTQVPYGIDYIDPWVSKLAPYDGIGSRAWVSNQIARTLEPYAVKKASLISGVSPAYFMDVLNRNFKNRPIKHVGMPYGFDPGDHQIELEGIKCPWPEDGSVEPYVYAGAFLPQSHLFISSFCKAIQTLAKNDKLPAKAHFYFLGTGFYRGKTIADYAKETGLEDRITEYRQRYPFLHIQHFLRKAKGLLIVGSTERHYTASKTFQCLITQNPIWAVFHMESSAAAFLQQCKADQYLNCYMEGMSDSVLDLAFTTSLDHFLNPSHPWKPDLKKLDPYSARSSAEALVKAIDAVL